MDTSPAPGATVSELLRRGPQDVSARIVQDRTLGLWQCWYGHTTGRFWALPPRSHPWKKLLEEDTPEALCAAVEQIDHFYGGPW